MCCHRNLPDLQLLSGLQRRYMLCAWAGLLAACCIDHTCLLTPLPGHLHWSLIAFSMQAQAAGMHHMRPTPHTPQNSERNSKSAFHVRGLESISC